VPRKRRKPLASAARERARPQGRRRRRLDAAKVLPDLVRKLLEIGDPDVLLFRVLALCREFVGADEVSLAVVEGDQLVEQVIQGRRRRDTVRLRIGAEGLGGWCAARKKTVICPDVRKDSRYVEASSWTRSEADVPILVGDRLVGVLGFESSKPGFFSPSDRELLEFLASQLAIGLRLEEVSRRGDRLATQLGMLNHLGRAGTTMEPPAFLQRVADAVRRTFDCSYAAVCLGDYPRERVLILAQSASQPHRLVVKGVALPFGKGMIGSAFRIGETVNARDVRKDPNYVAHIAETRSEIDVPIRAGDRCLGIVDAQSDRLGAFGDDETQTLETLARSLVPVLERLNGQA